VALVSVNAPPAVTILSPPAGFVAPKMSSFRGYHPSKTELAAAPGVISDLGKFADYVTVLGTSAPAASSVVEAITAAMGWRALRGPTEVWDTYVRAEDAMAWQVAITLLDRVKPLFLIAVAANPTLATMYPGLAQMFNAPKLSARQAQVTKKKNAKAAVASAAAAKSAAVAASAAPVAPASPTVLVNAQAGGNGM
jgi:hypothetical protein